MSERDDLRGQVYGVYSHVNVLHALEGLSAEQAGQRPAGAPHSIYQLVRHMIYWQDIGLDRLRGDQPERPATAAEGWTADAAPDAGAWDEAREELASGLWELEAMLEPGGVQLDAAVGHGTARQNVLMLLCHNSYHVGEVVMLRRQLGAWPPPKGGDTW